MRDETIENQFSQNLDGLRILAQQDLLEAWSGNTGVPFVEFRKSLEDDFPELVRAYGSAAAAEAADYVFLQRSLDRELSGLAFPSVSDPVDYEKALASYMWATRVADAKMLSTGDEAIELAMRSDSLRKLQGVTNRLVTEPARNTVFEATVAAGTRYARIPEPGACDFCLMLASRGAVYSRDTVVGNSMNSYHDGCRCLGIEVKSDSELPQINKDLMEKYKNGELS